MALRLKHKLVQSQIQNMHYNVLPYLHRPPRTTRKYVEEKESTLERKRGILKTASEPRVKPKVVFAPEPDTIFEVDAPKTVLDAPKPVLDAPKAVLDAPPNKAVNEKNALFDKLTLANYNVLGRGAWNNVDPFFTEADVLTDPAGLTFIQTNDPAGAGAASSAIYKKVGVMSFPAHVRAKVTKTSDAALATYRDAEVIHVVGPNGKADRFYKETAFFDALVEAYTHVFDEFGKSKRHHLRLVPVSGGLFAGLHKAAIPRLTLAAIRAALQRTTATAKLQKPETTYRLCVYGKHHEYVTLFPKS
jgi:hypothetical protein